MAKRRTQTTFPHTAPTTGRRPGRPAANPCRALVPLDTAKVRARLLKDRTKAEKALWKAEEEWRRFAEVDQPAYHRWVHGVGGPLRADVESLQRQFQRLSDVLNALCACAEMRRDDVDRVAMDLVGFVRTTTGKMTEELERLPLDDWMTHATAFFEREHARLTAEAETRRAADGEDGETEDDGDWDGVRGEDSWGGEPDDDANWDGDDGDDDWDDEDIDSELDAIFGRMGNAERATLRDFLGLPAASPPRRASRPVRDLYRDLCRKLHPDAGGEMTASRRALWDQVQRAYEERDVETLEALLARTELELEPAAAARAAPSRLLALIQHLKAGLRSVQSLIRRGKREPAWGFTAWTETRRQRAQERIRSELAGQQAEIRADIEEHTAEFMGLLRAALHRRRPPRKKPRRERFSMLDDAQALFDFL